MAKHKVNLLKILTTLGADDGPAVKYGIVGLIKFAMNRCEAHGYVKTRRALEGALTAAESEK